MPKHPHQSAAPVNAKTRQIPDPTKFKSVRNVKIKDSTFNEVNGTQNNTNVYNYTSESDKQLAELDDLDRAHEICRKEILTQAGPRSVSPLKAYLQNLRRISDLDPNAISQYAQDDALSFIPLLQSENHDISLATIQILQFYASHRIGWRPVSEQPVVAELVRLLSSEYPDIQLIAARIFSKLAPHRSVSEAALKLGVVQYLVPLLSNFECPELQKAAAVSLVHVIPSYDEKSRLDAAQPRDAFKALIPLLNNDVTMHDAVKALYVISSSSTDLYPISFNDLRPLIGLLSNRTTDTKMKLSAALVLKNITPRIILTPNDIPLLRDFLRAFWPLGENSQTQSTIITTLGNLGKSHVTLQSILPYFGMILPELQDLDIQMLFCDTLAAIIPPQDSEAIQIAEDARLPEGLKAWQNGGHGSGDLSKKVVLILGRLRPHQQGDASTFNFRKLFRTPQNQ